MRSSRSARVSSNSARSVIARHRARQGAAAVGVAL
jgi:hypothetical protein